jgi:hypothetical protein
MVLLTHASRYHSCEQAALEKALGQGETGPVTPPG